jgi:molybdopterin-binding protein
VVNAEVVVELPGGDAAVSIITKEPADNLAPAPGKEVSAIIKASNVTTGVE